MIFLLVDSLENIDPSQYLGAYFITPDGFLYQAQQSDELGGIGSFFKSLGKIALNVGGSLVGMPGVGNALLGGGGNSSQATNDAAIAQIRGEIDKIINAVGAGQLNETQGHAELARVYKAWDAWKMSQDEKSKGYLYHTGDVQVFRWSDASAQIAAYGAAQKEAAEAAKPNPQATSNFWGFTPMQLGIGIGVIGLIFLFRG